MCQWKKNKYYIYEISPLFPVTLKLIKLIMKKPPLKWNIVVFIVKNIYKKGREIE